MRISIAAFVLAGALMMGAIARAADQPADPVSVLKSGASFLEKEAACRTLSTRPSPEAVPVLAGLLTDEKLSHMARYALEPMLYPEAGQALRDALGKTSGRLRVGVINSLAIRKDEQAVPELLKLLPGESEVARAVAVALGVIATPDAEKALSDAIVQAPISQGRLNALCDGLLGCAERHAIKGEKDQAIAIYDRLLQIANTSSQVQIGALRGAVLSRGAEQGLPLLVERLGGENADAFIAALRVSRELGSNRNLAAALAGVLPNLPPERKVRILDVFGDKDGEAAGEAALALANDGPVDVRVVALRALTRMGYTPALKLVSQLAWAEDEKLAEAARDSLAYGYGKDGDAALEALLQSDQTKARRVAVELIGRGGLDNPVALLMKVAGADADEAVRVAALDGLHDRAGIEELAGLLDTVVKGRSAPELKAAESTLAALCERQKQMPGAIVIQKAVYGDLTPGAPTADVLAQVSRMVSAGAPSIEATNANFGEPAPGVVKQLRVDYTENGAPISKTVKEGETLKFTVGAAPVTLVDAFCGAFAQAQGEPKLSMLRLLGTTGSPKAFDIVRTASSGEGAIKETALRTLCEWPTPDALPVLMELAKTSPDEGMKVLALRGAVRLSGQSAASPAENLER
ncbi:MAG: hypothetical protein HZB26_05560, partial [Candidatus Hydrogenedentes bacterium]|nr:hypothetical protein [Candidatus Hydrogenedentota bacterium]